MENSSLISQSVVSFVAFEFIELFYWFLEVHCLVRILIKFLHFLGFGVMDWKVKLKTEILGIDLIVCSLEKVIQIKKPLN